MAYEVGEVIHFYPENMTIIVVMSSEQGVRYIDPNNLEFDDQGNLKTQYVENEAFSEWSTALGTINNISAVLRTTVLTNNDSQIKHTL